eukprot:scaffold912_cov121-Skeletonema_dohrnii-CCMP3373.AAC.6
MPFIRSICSCTFKAISKIFGLSRACNNKKARSDDQMQMPNDRASVLFSIEPSLQESSIAPMSSLLVSEPSSSMIGYGTEESSSPDSVDLGKIFMSANDSASVFAQDISDDNSSERGDESGSAGALVTPLEHDSKNIVSIMQSNANFSDVTGPNCTSELRPYNLNVTHFHEDSHTSFDLAASVQSITPSEAGTANTGISSVFKVDTNIAADGSPSSSVNSIESIVAKKYPVTPYPKLAVFSSPTIEAKKRTTKLPKSVIAMRRGVVKMRVGHIQKKLDRQLQDGNNCS